jgi:hypothetical protein
MAGQDFAPLFIVGAPRSGASLVYKLPACIRVPPGSRTGDAARPASPRSPR